MPFYAQVLETLSEAGVRYVVVGGVAVVMHGYLRMTQDIDIVVDLKRENALRAVDTLTAMGLRPFVPVDAREFADPAKRREWIDERNMKVFSMRDWKDPFLSVDLFVQEPVPFDELAARATEVAVGASKVLVAAIGDLIVMKRDAGRPRDLEDIEKLEEIGRTRR
jgi:predicted nucleotidyltransferase